MKFLSAHALRHGLFGLAVLAGFAVSGAAGAAEEPSIEPQNWTFSGLTGYYDNAQLRRGYMVYKTVCAACHSMRPVRPPTEPGICAGSLTTKHACGVRFSTAAHAPVSMIRV